MSDNPPAAPQNSVRGLVQDLSERFDAMSNALRKETAFAETRPADAKTFMLISRHPRGLTALATALGISRQAAHRSVQRLVDAGLVSFDYAEGSQRDMIAGLTKKGLGARAVGLRIAREIDAYVEKKVGKEGLETLRDLLLKLADD
ncbi:MarR family winged helix-turn-helix transcriptional regulator [Bauldia sp.]|uniref:MarR family winged helix-turn-helix transcriptional regulator n=1 Tax=Bauldia sp. TaxID=2575872 RepID=UPI003BADB93D